MKTTISKFITTLGVLALLLVVYKVTSSSTPTQSTVVNISMSWDSQPSAEELVTNPLLNTIVTGEIVTSHPGKSQKNSNLPGGQVVFTDWEVKVTEYLAHPLPYKHLAVRVPGGTLNGLTYDFEDVAEFHDGETVILFLGKDTSFFTLTENEFTVMYGDIGAYHISLSGEALNHKEKYDVQDLLKLVREKVKNISPATPTPFPLGAPPPSTATPALP
jgi:hypothetical protein